MGITANQVVTTATLNNIMPCVGLKREPFAAADCFWKIEHQGGVE